MSPITLSLQPVGLAQPLGVCTRNLADGQLATVQQGITDAAPGEVVCVPAGSWTWTQGLTISKRITLRGAGIDLTTITMNFINTSSITWTTQPGGLNRLTGFTFISQAGVGAGGDLRVVEVYGLEKAVRIDHCKWVMNALLPLRIWGFVRGVVDHNIFDLTHYPGSFARGWMTHHDKWNNIGRFGDASWAAPDTWGTDEAMYFEDNQIIHDNTAVAPGAPKWVLTNDGWNGSRVVTRYNLYTNTSVSGGHGTDSGGRQRGRRQQETYREIMNYDCSRCGAGGTPGTDNSIIGIAGRAGPMMVWDNTMTATGGMTFSAPMNMKTFRQDLADPAKPAYQTWGLCGQVPITSLTTAGVMITAGYHGIFQAIVGAPPNNLTWVRITGATGPDAAIYNGYHNVAGVTSTTVATLILTGTPAADAVGSLVITGPYDGNTTTMGYPCLDQVGYGQSDLLGNSYCPTPPGWPNQVLTPSLYFLNTVNAARVDPISMSPPGGLVLNREYFTDGPASQIRTGPLAARPATCVVNEIYWATNDGSWNTKPGGLSGKMYKCLAANVWTAWYGRNNATGEPLTYPHPLTLMA